MALQGPDGETHSHLNSEDRRDSYSKHLAQQPDRGTWVGPRPGQTHEQHAEGVRRANAAKEWGDRIDLENRQRQYEAAARSDRMNTVPEEDKVSAAIRQHLDSVRIEAFERIEYLIEHLPMTSAQRRLLVQALGILSMRP